MAAADDFGRVSAVLSELAPDADISGIEVTESAARIVTVQTRSWRRLVGPRGSTADALRAVLAERLGDERLQLNIVEARPHPPPGGRPADGPGVMYPPQ